MSNMNLTTKQKQKNKTKQNKNKNKSKQKSLEEGPKVKKNSLFRFGTLVAGNDCQQ